MSQENVEIAHRLTEAWQREDLDGWLSPIDANVEWLSAAERGMGGQAYRGHAGVRELWAVWHTEFVDFWVEIDEARDLGGDSVLLLGHAGFRGPASGVMVHSELAQVFTIRCRAIIRSMDYASHDEALKAVGLAE